MWLLWLDEEYNVPSRSDFYVMQLTASVDSLPARVWGRKPPNVNISTYRIKFNSMMKKVTVMGKEALTKVAKSRWFALTGYKRNGRND